MQKILPAHLQFRCLVCNKKIELNTDFTSGSRTRKSPPIKAVSLLTCGNYGSEVYDLCPEAEAMVCDKCFVKRSGSMITTKISNGEVENVYVKDIIFSENKSILSHIISFFKKIFKPFKTK